jgi:hypothetical protein
VYELNTPNQDIYIVEFERHLGVSLILRAECEVAATLQAWRRFPEYKRIASRTRVSALDYAEVDWETGRCFVVKLQKRTPIPVFTLDEPTKRRRNTKREEDAQ